MHEMSLLRDLLQEVERQFAAAREAGATDLVALKVRIGALAHISGDHFREHFEHATRDHVAKDTRLDIVELTDESDPEAQEIVLESIEVA